MQHAEGIYYTEAGITQELKYNVLLHYRAIGIKQPFEPIYLI
jgi:hypothetical protein